MLTWERIWNDDDDDDENEDSHVRQKSVAKLAKAKQVWIKKNAQDAANAN